MHTEEQAYINGFLKRAALHGISAEDALYILKEAEKPLLKEATTFGATRKLLRQLNADGFEVIRRPADMTKKVITDLGGSTDSTDFKNLLANSRALKKMGPLVLGGELKKIYLPKAKHLKNYVVQQNTPALGRTDKRLSKQKNYSPRQSLFHEAGHAEHMVEDPSLQFSAAPLRALLQERIANNNAINFMKNNNVPKSHIDSYIKDFDNSFATYLDPKYTRSGDLVPWRPYSPSYSVEI